MEHGAWRTGRRHDLWTAVATLGFAGYLPLAPGTWASALGLLLGAVAVRVFAGWLVVVLLAVGFLGGALICTQAERQLGRHDPPPVVLDEVWGMAFVVIAQPAAASSVALLLVAFVLFRIFDIAKPWPIKWLARLPAGWGIMADDLGAAGYAAAVLWVAWRLAG